MKHLEKMESLARDICNKPDLIPIEECHQSWGRTNPLCNEHEVCRILEKSPEQIEYIFSPNEENVFLKACPGSGKTEVVGLKAAYSIRKWHRLGGMAVLTFTNNAANVINQRVSQFTGAEKAGYPHFIGTIDSWLHGYIAHPFAHLKTGYEGQSGDCSIRIVENSATSEFLYSFRTKYRMAGMGNPSANQYYLDMDPARHKYIFSSGNQGTDNARNAVPLQSYQINDLNNTKEVFWKSGFATYQDIENLCFNILSEKSALCKLLAQRFPLIIVDECQDLSWIQIQILDKLREQGTVLHFVGDLNQAIYEFKRVDPEQVKIFTDSHKFKPLSLSNNYRSCQSIIDICQKIVGSDSSEKSACTQSVEKPCICVIYSEDQIHLLPVWFGQYLNQACDKNKSAIVARNWNNVSRMRPSPNTVARGPQMGLAMAIHLWESREYQAIDDALKYAGRFVSDKYFPKYSSNPRQYYCPECIDSYLRWRLFLSRSLNACCADRSTISDLNQPWPNWVQNVRSQFGNIISEYRPLMENSFTDAIPEFGNLDGYHFKTPPNTGGKSVWETLPSFHKHEQGNNLRITTIHSVKGETLDAILLVSAPSKQGTTDGHWTQWLEYSKTEAARLAYVASSRPKHLLAWAIPETMSKQEKGRIHNIGFHVVEMKIDGNP